MCWGAVRQCRKEQERATPPPRHLHTSTADAYHHAPTSRRSFTLAPLRAGRTNGGTTPRRLDASLHSAAPLQRGGSASLGCGAQKRRAPHRAAHASATPLHSASLAPVRSVSLPFIRFGRQARSPFNHDPRPQPLLNDSHLNKKREPLDSRFVQYRQHHQRGEGNTPPTITRHLSPPHTANKNF